MSALMTDIMGSVMLRCHRVATSISGTGWQVKSNVEEKNVCVGGGEDMENERKGQIEIIVVTDLHDYYG